MQLAYRPASLTSVVCKVMKGIVKNNVLEHLNEYNFIKGSQHLTQINY